MMDFVVANWHLFLALAVVLVLLAGTTLLPRLYGVRSLTSAEAVRLMNQDQGVVVDVCEAGEFKGGHIPHAVSAPLSALANHLGALEKYRQRPVIVSCRSGNRSLRGAIQLRKQGFERVYSLRGGLDAWRRDNLPVETG
jgi:rhodanese-related sulfurtransferase